MQAFDRPEKYQFPISNWHRALRHWWPFTAERAAARYRRHAGAVTLGFLQFRYQRFRFMTESRSLLSTLSIDPLASLGFCPMRGSDGFRLVFERSLPLVLKLSVAPRSKAPLVVTSDGPPIELPTPCQSACAAEVASNAIITVIVLIIAPSACRLVGSG